MSIPPSELRPSRKLWALLTADERRAAPGHVVLMLVALALEVLSVGAVVPTVALLMNDDPADALSSLAPLGRLTAGMPRPTLVVTVMSLLVVLFLVKALFLAFVTWRQMGFTHRVEVSLSQRLLTLYLRQPYTFHLERNSAQLVNRVVIESNVVAEGAVFPTLVLIAEGLVLAGLGLLLLLIEPVGAISVGLAVGAAALLVHWVMRRGVSRWGEARHRHAELSMQHLQQGLGAVRDVLLLAREKEFLRRYMWHNVRRARAAQNQATAQRLPRLALELFVITGMAALTITLLAQGRAPETVLPTLGLFAVAAFRVMPSVSRFMNSLQMTRFAASSIHALHSDLHTLQRPPEIAGDPIEFEKQLVLAGVSYTYPSAPRKALDNVSLEVRRGETVGIVGASGAGKTTLVDVVLGLLTPDEGRVLVDGHDIHGSLHSWQSRIGYVPQTIYLTDDTLRRNIAFGLSDNEINEGAVVRAVSRARLNDLVAQSPNGLETRVGERGIRLSGGQRQRIGLARALYNDPAVLVLDEATSALDTAMEAEVLSAIETLHGETTVLIVAHRSSAVQHCDRLCVLEHGRIVQAATPGDVLRPSLRDAESAPDRADSPDGAPRLLVERHAGDG